MAPRIEQDLEQAQNKEQNQQSQVKSLEPSGSPVVFNEDLEVPMGVSVSKTQEDSKESTRKISNVTIGALIICVLIAIVVAVSFAVTLYRYDVQLSAEEDEQLLKPFGFGEDDLIANDDALNGTAWLAWDNSTNADGI
ncbi:expressed unknown protein [Seminavis robusta]|uniref:Uncharacterized protein n=1 Tax=Seminavis robusta TaxID=568900 RepID=A0A9N8EDH6_9STRA|nr:expressed unknown protein [Seminavis robusta]|eukprot:Sro1017_g231740.1 n/a (138) ;mRNA; f:16958-17371